MITFDTQEFKDHLSQQLRELNMKVLVQSENVDTIVAKQVLRNNFSSKKPFQRLRKQKDVKGIFVVVQFRCPVKVYQKDWLFM